MGLTSALSAPARPADGGRVLGFLLELAAGGLVTWADGRRRSGKRARAAARGAEVGFAACVLGDRPYCRNRALVHLWVSGAVLHVTPTEFPELHRSRVPPLRLVAVRRRDRRGDPRLVQVGWEVAECRDGDRSVLIGCAPDSMELLRGALVGVAGE